MINTTSSEKVNVAPTGEKKKYKWGKKEKIVGAIVLFIFVMMFVVASNGDKNPASTQNTINSSIQYRYSAGTPERAAEEKVRQILGEKTNTEEKRIKAIAIEKDGMGVEFNANENLTTGMTRRGIWTDIKELSQEVPSLLDSEWENLAFIAYLNLTDAYGNTSPEKVMSVVITKKTWEKINWDNFITENVPKVVDQYWEHPALSK